MLSNDKVLVAGSSGCSNHNPAITELHDAGTGVWTVTGNLNVPRADPALVLLNNGKALLAGGIDTTGATSITGASELYDPSTGSWSVTGTLNVPRSFMGVSANFSDAVLLANGQVLADGGIGTGGTTLSSAEVYNPTTGSWTLTGSMSTPRRDQRTIALPNGNALAMGGIDASSALLASTELFRATDLTLSLSVNPTIATTGTTVMFNGSLSNTSSASRNVQVASTLTYTASGGPTQTVFTTTNSFTMTAGQTINTPFTFSVSSGTPRGLYTLTVVASDSTGSVQASASLNVV